MSLKGDISQQTKTGKDFILFPFYKDFLFGFSLFWKSGGGKGFSTPSREECCELKALALFINFFKIYNIFTGLFIPATQKLTDLFPNRNKNDWFFRIAYGITSHK